MMGSSKLYAGGGFFKSFVREAIELTSTKAPRSFRLHHRSYATSSEGTPTLSLVGKKMQTILNEEGPINTLCCPLGVAQTLALVGAISEAIVKGEVNEFVQNPNVVEEMTALNKLLQTSEKSYSTGRKRDPLKFEFANGVYAVLASHLNIDRGSATSLAEIGAEIMDVDFSDPSSAAAKLNKIVEKDTRGKIKKLFSESSFSQDSLFILLHTLYVNASWTLRDVEESHFKFKDTRGKGKNVKCLTANGAHLHFTQNEGVTYVMLPTLGGCHLTLRHSSDLKDLKVIEPSDIISLMNTKPQYTHFFHAPFVSMKKTLNLKRLLKNYFPKLLEDSFQTTLANEHVQVAKYIQKVTFDMTDKGVEASSATALHGEIESAVIYQDGPIITINSPFSFALTRTLAGQNYLLFQGQVVNHDVLKKHDWFPSLKD